MTNRELHLGHVFNYWNRKSDHRIQVYMEHNCIHIKMFCSNGVRRFWDCADTMTEARALIREQKQTEYWKDYDKVLERGLTKCW